MIRCDLIGPDGEPNQADRLILGKKELASVFRVDGCRQPPSAKQWAEWVSDALPNYGSHVQISWLQHPGQTPDRAVGSSSLELLLDAKQKTL